jgi:DNA-binding transcriptional LysR family regulator
MSKDRSHATEAEEEDFSHSRPFKISQLITLSAVAKHGSLTRAAEALGVSQPSISQQIREVEQIAGLPVIQPKGRSIALTPLGVELAEVGRRISVERERAARIAARHREGSGGHLVIGASMTTSAHLLPKVISDLQRGRPQVAIELRVANTVDVAQMVLDDVVDIGVIEGDLSGPELTIVPFARDRLLCIAHARHHLHGVLSPSDVANETLLVREDGSGSRQVVLAALAAQGFHFKRTLLFGSNETIRNAVGYGLGIAWLSQIIVEPELAKGAIRELQFLTPPIERDFSVIRRRDTKPTPLGDAFVSRLEAYGASTRKAVPRRAASPKRSSPRSSGARRS